MMIVMLLRQLAADVVSGKRSDDDVRLIQGDESGGRGQRLKVKCPHSALSETAVVWTTFYLLLQALML